MEPVDSFGEWFGFVGGILVLAAIIALVAWNIGRLNTGKVTLSELTCIDPTDPCNWSSYQVRNDTSRPVVLRECLHHCGDGDSRGDPIQIEPRAVSPNDVYRGASATVGDRAWWEVRTTSARLLGCLVLDGHAHKHDGDLVVVSSARSCSSDQMDTPVSITA
jgi:hypothetical protein